jgi:fermentation-respiration switch protein FrsA (DUF1100 family)
MRRLAVGLAALFLAAYLALVLVGVFLSDRMIFVPHESSYQASADVTMLHTAHASHIAARYLPNPAAKYTLLFSHGNGEDLGDDREYLQKLHDDGFAVMTYDYDGYGLSDGSPTEANVYDGAEAAYGYLVRDQHTSPAHIISFGRSVGTGPAVELAKRHRVAALIVQSGFTSAFRVLTHYKLVPFDRFRNSDKVRSLTCPKFFIHGRDDSVVPFWHGVALFNAAAAPKEHWWVDGADHNNLEDVAGEKYFERLRAFAAQLP